MKRAVLRSGLVGLTLGAALSACGGTSTVTSPPTTDLSLTLTTQHSPVGPILATGGGSTLYDFTPDTPTHSACLNDGCVYQWPPLIVDGPLNVGPGVSRSLVGTLKRPDGTTQVSYGGHPLYTYRQDVQPGMVMGQAIDQNGGPWYVLSPAGREVRTTFTVSG